MAAGITEEEYVLVLPPHLKKKLPLETVIIDAINDAFNYSMKRINKQTTIGVSLEGSNIGRYGNLSWLCISTSYTVYLFDIKTLKNEAFAMGLKEILEDSYIQKVFHNCRNASDCLYHQYNTTLTNLFDTQVADYFVTLQKSNCDVPLKHVNPLHKCLMDYLNLDSKYVHIENKESDKMDKLSFSFRPITNECRDAAIKHCIYLCMLKEILLNSLMGPYNYAVQMYLRMLSTASDAEAHIQQSELHLAPNEFLHGLEIFRIKRKEEESEVVSDWDKLEESLKNLHLKINAKQLQKSNLPKLQNKLKQVNADISLKTHVPFEESLAINKTHDPNSPYLEVVAKKPQESCLLNQQKQTEQKCNVDPSLGSCGTRQVFSANNENNKPRKTLFDIVPEKNNTSPQKTHVQNQAKQEIHDDILKEVSTTRSEVENKTSYLNEKYNACYQNSNIRPLPPIHWDLIRNDQESPKYENITFIPAGMILNTTRRKKFQKKGAIDY